MMVPAYAGMRRGGEEARRCCGDQLGFLKTLLRDCRALDGEHIPAMLILPAILSTFCG
jgi:hypothetical protein